MAPSPAALNTINTHLLSCIRKATCEDQMTTVTISLPESLREFIEHQVKTKGYGNVSEYFRLLLREAQERESDKRLETLLLESLDDDRPDVKISPEFWEIAKKRLVERVERKTRSLGRKL